MHSAPAGSRFLEVEAAPTDAVVADPEDRDAANVDRCAVGACPEPTPLAPDLVAGDGSSEELGTEVCDGGEDGVQRSRTASRPRKSRSGLSGCTLSYSRSKQSSSAARSRAFIASR